MTMLRTTLLAAVLLAGVAQAAPPALSDQQISTIAGMMFQAYAEGGVPQMFADEMKCWDDASKTKRADKNVVAACATAAMSGGLIEASFARKQRRGPSPQYAGDAIRARISDLSGLNPDVLQSLSDETLRPGVPAMLTGLQGAGMR
ncbi:hypothetical protein [Xylophilus sp.]|uniref:hypothetical protein n=1 Tax=Xylophilus sp. TaxID=2653893 RepID=UPI0013BE2435|nr:hypothetical protein [Xylophilus sp.]KAF1049702.1 MAG: hypothetical protein GAK38_00365 [Xylophilus sp.]